MWDAGRDVGVRGCVMDVHVRIRISSRVRNEGRVCVWMGVRRLIASHFSFTLSLARLSGHVWSCCALCLDLLVLLSSSSNSSPSAPGIEKISPNHQHQHPDPPAHHPTNRPTTHHIPPNRPTTHEPQTASSLTQLPSPKVQPRITRPGSASGCALPVPISRGSRYPRAPCAKRLISSSSLGSWVSGLGSILFYELRTRLVLSLALVSARLANSQYTFSKLPQTRA